MIVDSSALMAILLQEPEAGVCSVAIERAEVCRISAGTLLEAMIVADRRGDAIGRHMLDELLAESAIIVEPVTEEHARIGRDAHRDFGRNSGNSARLNHGDCFAYALAKTTGEPLLFIGNDFSHTDLHPAT
jgi:ribonuclease VapC